MANYKSDAIGPIKHIKFSQKIGKEFTATLNKRVRSYFKENNISKHANLNMKLKTVFMLLLFLTPVAFLCSGLVESVWLAIVLYVVVGLGTAGIGLSVMHDANHGAYSKKAPVNKFVGRFANMIGGFAPNWQIQHNVLHHTYTNVHGYDEDIMPPKFLRFSPNEEWRPIHRFQHLYAWFFYGLMTFAWITIKDFQQYFRYKKMDLIKAVSPKPGLILFELIVSKVLYYTFIMVIPMIVMDISLWWYPLFFFILHFVAGSILSYVFQPAHVISDTNFVAVDESLSIENGFAIHQMQTTANFAPRSNILYWLIGGLNYQVEHHLFPNICHVHYKKISKIVKATAEEYGIPYYSHATFFGALKYHMKLLRSLGRGQAQVA